MSAIQIVELVGPDSALKEVDVPEPEASHMLTPGSGGARSMSRPPGSRFPEVLQTRGRVPAQAAAAVRSRERGRRDRAQRAGGLVARASGDRVAGFPMLGGFAEVAVSPEFLTFPLPRRARLLGKGAALDPQLPHGLVLAGHPRAPEGGGDGARPRRRRRRRHGLDPGRQGARRPDDRRRLHRREGGGGPRGRRRRGGSLRRRLEGRGEGALRGRGGPRRRPGRRRSLHRLAALARRGRAASSSSASPPARSPRSRSTACCSTTSRSSAPGGAPT